MKLFQQLCEGELVCGLVIDVGCGGSGLERVCGVDSVLNQVEPSSDVGENKVIDCGYVLR